MATIRLATAEDIPRIIELYGELTISTSEVERKHSPSLEDYQNVFAEICADPRHELLVAEYEGKVVGTVVLLIVPNLSHNATPWALVENIVIGHQYRRHGYGRLLLEEAIARAKGKGCFKIELCSDKRRKEAHQFYESVGFEASAYGFRSYF
ncbi:MAG: GNAT family N-acetyltransferase [Chloroflexota bacterium]|nr:GNAT family N-acetyltransferase [Chloroflexota bacterium]